MDAMKVYQEEKDKLAKYEQMMAQVEARLAQMK